MPLLIPANQNGFVKGRSVLDAVRSIDEWTNPVFYLQLILKRLSSRWATNVYIRFYRKWVLDQIFFNGLELSVETCQDVCLIMALQLISFFVKRGVRQGDPLSPLLFILALETLVCQIRENKNIKGFLINGKEIKTTLFADDMTCFLRYTNSYFQLLTSLQNFARYSVLRVNDEKTEIFAIDPHSLVQDVFTHKIRSTQLDWRPTATLSQSRKTLNSWKGRAVTLIGNIQVVKSFTIPKFLSKAALISVPEDQVKEISKFIYHFIWKGNDKSNNLR